MENGSVSSYPGESGIAYSTSSEAYQQNGSGILSVVQIVNCCAGIVLTFFTIVGQIIVFIVISRDARLRRASNLFIISLAGADFLIGIISMPVWTVFTTLGYWPVSQIWCDIWNIFDHVLCVVSIYTILFVSIDRYLSLRFPLKYRKHRTKRKLTGSLMFVWVITTVAISFYVKIIQDRFGTIRDPLDCNTYCMAIPILTFLFLVFTLWLGVAGTGIIYIMIYRIAQGSGKVMKTTESDLPTVSTVEINILSSRRNNDKFNSCIRRGNGYQNGKGKLRKTQRTMALLFVTFALCWLPLSLVMAVDTIHPGCLSVWWKIVGYWLGYINSMLNPLCYALGNPYFKETVCNMFRNKSPKSERRERSDGGSSMTDRIQH